MAQEQLPTFCLFRRETAFPDLFYSFLYPYIANLSDSNFAQGSLKNHVSLASNSKPLVTDCDARIDLIYNDFSKLVKSIGLAIQNSEDNFSSSIISKDLFPVCMSIPDFEGACTNITRVTDVQGKKSLGLHHFSKIILHERRVF